MLELNNLNIGYTSKKGSKSILKELNVKFENNSLIGLAGNNGTGKSTLLKTIVGSIQPIEGSIILNGKNITEYSQQELAKIISVVFTDKITGFNLTVKDVVAAGRIPYLNSFGILQEEDNRIVDESLNSIGIRELKENLFDELSDGQKQKVLIAKSLTQQTPIILMDEPTAFLDYESRKMLFDLLKELASTQHKLIIVSSHDLDLLFKKADKVLYFHNDFTYKFASPKEIQA